MPISKIQGFVFDTDEAADKRLVLTKAEMKTAGSVKLPMPSNYLTVCKDDGKVYIYNETNEEDVDTGKFRLFKSDISAHYDEIKKELELII